MILDVKKALDINIRYFFKSKKETPKSKLPKRLLNILYVICTFSLFTLPYDWFISSLGIFATIIYKLYLFLQLSIIVTLCIELLEKPKDLLKNSIPYLIMIGFLYGIYLLLSFLYVWFLQLL